MKKEVVITKDGSSSIYIPEMDEHYHSTNGSITESEHIFIQMGLMEVEKQKEEISILEVGMGTGLNLLATIKAAIDQKLKIHYKGLEAYPLDWEMLKQLNYISHYSERNLEDYFKQIHEIDWNIKHELFPNFIIEKWDQKLQEVSFSEAFDLVYFDAFAPDKQEEMWTEKVFLKIYNAMSPNGLLVTYCVKGTVRRLLQSIGFEIEKVPGPIGGKREMLRAKKGRDEG